MKESMSKEIFEHFSKSPKNFGSRSSLKITKTSGCLETTKQLRKQLKTFAQLEGLKSITCEQIICKHMALDTCQTQGAWAKYGPC